jgi:hypothetical protein
VQNAKQTGDMPTAIDQYREAKNNYLKLRNQAKKELLARFHELAAELIQLQRELLEDFGEKIAIPAKPKKPRAVKPAQPEASVPAERPPAASPKVVELQKQLEREKKKLAAVQSAGKPTKAVDDRIYELEDEIRLLQAKK